MSRLKAISELIVAGMMFAACAPEAAPTVNAVDVQNTAVAAAFTMVFETEAAMPTATPLPPTEIPTQTPLPLPTDTPLPLPTSGTVLPPDAASGLPTSTAGGDPCLTRLLSWSPKGKPTKIRMVNTTKAAINVSLYLQETPDHFECGYRLYQLSPRGDVLITDLVQGCYNIWAYNDDRKIPVNAFGFGCINNTDKWTIEISQDRVKGP